VPVYNRSVSANYGMSYSISNVFADAGLDMILRWVPFDIDERDLRNRIKNKMIRPTTIPFLLQELIIEQAISREALRLSFEQHKQLASGLKGVQKERTIADTFDQSSSGETLVDMIGLNMVIGSGGVLSHAPRRQQSAMMMLDAFLPEGVTRLTVDSIFMMPQLGVLAEVHEEAAMQVFEKDCLIYLGTAVAPVGPNKEGKPVLSARVTMADGRTESLDLKYGDLQVLPLGVEETAKAVLTPAKGMDIGAGRGQALEATLHGGVCGVIFDCRGRKPFEVPTDKTKRLEKLAQWNASLDIYPELRVAVGAR